MTDTPARRRRLSRRALRALAWVAGGLAFASPFAALTAAPRPATAGDGASPRRVIIVRKITRRIVVHPAPEPLPVRYVYVGGGSSSAPSSPSTSSSSSSSSSSTGSSAVAAAPASTSTGGS